MEQQDFNLKQEQDVLLLLQNKFPTIPNIHFSEYHLREVLKQVEGVPRFKGHQKLKEKIRYLINIKRIPHATSDKEFIHLSMLAQLQNLEYGNHNSAYKGINQIMELSSGTEFDTSSFNYQPIAYYDKHIKIGSRIVNVENQLLPRLKTLSMVDHIIPNLQQDSVVIDIGTGTGCLPLYLLDQDKTKKITNIQGYDLEYKLRISHDQQDLIKTDFTTKDRNDIERDLGSTQKTTPLIIMANLPYSPEIDRTTKHDKRVSYEPDKAILGGGDDGLDIYKMYCNQISKSSILDNIGYIIFEAASNNVELLKQHCEIQFGKTFQITIENDCFNKPRFVAIKHNEKQY